MPSRHLNTKQEDVILIRAFSGHCETSLGSFEALVRRYDLCWCGVRACTWGSSRGRGRRGGRWGGTAAGCGTSGTPALPRTRYCPASVNTSSHLLPYMEYKDKRGGPVARILCLNESNVHFYFISRSGLATLVRWYVLVCLVTSSLVFIIYTQWLTMPSKV